MRTGEQRTDWTYPARMFIAFGYDQYLDRARLTCEDLAVAAFLERADVRNGFVADSELAPLLGDLAGRTEPDELAVIRMLGQRRMALAAGSPDVNDEKASAACRTACQQFVSLCGKYGFVECGAVFERALAYGAMRLGNYSEAQVRLERVLEFLRTDTECDSVCLRIELAETLIQYGIVLRQQGLMHEAQKAFEEADDVAQGLARAKPKVFRPMQVLALGNLANVLDQRNELAAAEKLLRTARTVFLERLPTYAALLNSLGIVLKNQRRFPEAQRVLEEARNAFLAILRELPQEVCETHFDGLANTLLNLGGVQHHLGLLKDSLDSLQRAYHVAKKLQGDKPLRYGPLLADVLNNIGNTWQSVRATGQAKEQALRKARAAYEECLDVREQILASHPDQAREFKVAHVCGNLAGVLGDKGELDEAFAKLERSRGILEKLAAASPDTYRPNLAETLGNLSVTLFQMGRLEEAYSVATKAIETAEKSFDDPSLFHLAKGRARNAYKRRAHYLSARDDADALFRCLAALRDGAVRASGTNLEDSLSGAVTGLREAENRVGRALRVLVAQDLGFKATLLGVLSSQEPHFEWCRAAEFGNRCEALFSKIQDVFDDNCRTSYQSWARLLAQLGADAWSALPEKIRAVLVPDGDHEILISGETAWTMFPWEALKYGSGDGDWLGLRRALVRWGPITEPRFSRVRNRVFGDGSLTAVLVCPYDVPGTAELGLSLEEINAIERALAAQGFRILPEGRPLRGSEATPHNFGLALAAAPAVVCYSGHGLIIQGEEALVLSETVVSEYDTGTRTAQRWPAYVGKTWFGHLKKQQGTGDALFRNSPLFVLNSCRSGQAREFGGHREDLVSALLSQGGEAVIASPFPVYEKQGRLLGEKLFGDIRGNRTGMATTFLKARVQAEMGLRGLDIWPTWALITYHGNPYANLPCAAGSE